MPERPRRLSLIRDLTVADRLTVGNGFAGAGSFLATLRFLVDGEPWALWLALALLPVALVLDFLDGRVARARGGSSPLGPHLDSLADLISFGVAPAALAFAIGMRGGWDALVLAFFVNAGLARLARYNATAASLSDDRGKVRYYEGTPIPTSLVLVALAAGLFATGRVGERLPLGAVTFLGATLHPLVLAWALSGAAMMSRTLRIPKP